MNRLIALHLAGSIALLLIGAIAGSEIVARPSGIDAPELSDPPVVPFVNGRPVIVPDWTAVLPYGAWGGCNGPCGETVGVIDDEAPPVPLPMSGVALLGAISAVVLVKTRILCHRQRDRGCVNTRSH